MGKKKSQSMSNKILRAKRKLIHLHNVPDYKPSHKIASLTNLQKHIKTAETSYNLVESHIDTRTERGSKRKTNFYHGPRSLAGRLANICSHLDTLEQSATVATVTEALYHIKATVKNYNRGKYKRKSDADALGTFSPAPSKLLAATEPTEKKNRKASGTLFHTNWLELNEAILHLKSLGPGYRPPNELITLEALEGLSKDLLRQNLEIDDIINNIQRERFNRDKSLELLRKGLEVAEGYLLVRFGKKHPIYQQYITIV